MGIEIETHAELQTNTVGWRVASEMSCKGWVYQVETSISSLPIALTRGL